MAVSGAVLELARARPSRALPALRALTRVRAWLRALALAVLCTYAQVLLSRSWHVGGLLFAATLWAPMVAAFGLVAVLSGLATARLLGLSREASATGVHTYSALLVGLGMGALLQPDVDALLLAILGGALTVPLGTALQAALGSAFALPALTLPFLATLYIVLAALPMTSAVTAFPVAAGPELAGWGPLALYLKSLGALLFLPRADVGAVVLVALLMHSRIAWVLSLLGFTAAYLTAGQLSGGASSSEGLTLLLGYNFILSAIAMGGIFFVPSVWSLLLALGACLVTGVLALAAQRLLGGAGVPVAILPFNAAVLLLLYALRQRVRDGRPKAVDFTPGTPEENLAYYETRVRRFGALYATRLQAPFRGRWTCTQGVDGALTHRGPWRFALDFEVRGADGRLYRDNGLQPSDYHCFQLPILASADGTVVRVVDGVRDNAIGELNLTENWGNLVVVHHGAGLYSVVAHLSPGTLRVREGQIVRQGEVLGRCGNSGRSAVPHLHFQLQASPRVGAPTLPVELHDVILVVLDGDEEHLCSTLVPQLGHTLRNVEPRAELRATLDFPYGEHLRFIHGASGRIEDLVHELDLAGNLLVRSQQTGAVLYFNRSDRLFTSYDVVGSRRSLLHLLRAALPRMPFETPVRLRWTDHLPHRALLPRPIAALRDTFAFLLPSAGLELVYRAERVADATVVRGESRRQGRTGAPLVETRAVLRDGLGLESLCVTVAGQSTVIVRDVNLPAAAFVAVRDSQEGARACAT